MPLTATATIRNQQQNAAEPSESTRNTARYMYLLSG